MNDRTATLLRGAALAIGVLAVVDNVVVHWILGLHRLGPWSWVTSAEAALVALGAVVTAATLRSERRERRARSDPVGVR